MVKEAVEALGGKAKNSDVREWILKKYPGTNTTTIGCQIIMCTVNHPSRIHYPQNQRPRKAEGHQDFLFRTARGDLEMYEPDRHGQYEIAELEDGRLVVRDLGDDPNGNGEEDGEGKDNVCGSFAMEAHLRDYLAKNLSVIEDGLQLYVDDDQRVGVEYRTDMGRIDILAVDKQGEMLVIELKVERGPDQVCGQIMRYVGWVRRHLAKGKKVRGLIIAKHISDRVKYALADVPDVSVREYLLNVTLQDVRNIPDRIN